MIAHLPPFEMLIALLVMHMLADYPLQGAFLAEAKNPNTRLGDEFWPYALSAHALIQGGGVWLITGSVWLCLAEAMIHALIDMAKCEGLYGMFADQMLHGACKVAWVFAVFLWLV
jgi:hypothetical protein